MAAVAVDGSFFDAGRRRCSLEPPYPAAAVTAASASASACSSSTSAAAAIFLARSPAATWFLKRDRKREKSEFFAL